MSTMIRDGVKLGTLNSLTKYPSIPTYHHLGEKGRLQPTHLTVPTSPLFATEKIDGTNARVILSPDGDAFIGSREHLLWAKGDRIGDPAQGIVEALRKLATAWGEEHGRTEPLGIWTVVFGEVYGGRTTGCKSYGDQIGFRVFDAMMFTDSELATWEQQNPSQLSAWRDAGGQSFMDHGMLTRLVKGLEGPEMVPAIPCDPPPDGLAETQAWLSQVAASTRVGDGPAEGIVLRNASRSFICKIRHEDYRRTLR